MSNEIVKTKRALLSKKAKKVYIIFSLILNLCVFAFNAATPAAYANDLGKVEEALGLNNVKTDDTKVLSNVLSIITMVARIGGIILGAFGLYKFIIALKDQDGNGVTQGIVLLAVGVVLFLFKTILKAVFGVDV